MKHLKPYENASIYEIKQDLEDICLELSDMGFNTSIDFSFLSNFNLILSINITKPYRANLMLPGFKFIYTPEIHEIILRVLDYMKIMGWNIIGDCKIFNYNSVPIMKYLIFKGDEIFYSDDHNNHKNIKGQSIHCMSLSFKNK